MGGKSGKQKAQTGTCGYWPYASLFSQQNGCGLAPFFSQALAGRGFGAGCGAGGCGISPLAFPFAGLGGGFGGFGGAGAGFGGLGGGLGGFGGNALKGKVNIKDITSGAKLALKW
jgi:hypothetical protein